MSELRQCFKCNEYKTKDNFHKEKRGNDGLRRECKQCSKIRMEERYSKNGDSIKKRIKEWKIEQEKNGTVQYWNIRANKQNDRAKSRYEILDRITGNELMELFIRDKRCGLCKNEITHKECHIDHIIPLSKGGSNLINNIMLTCPHCNLRKSDKLISNEYEYFLYIKQVYMELKEKYECQ